MEQQKYKLLVHVDIPKPSDDIQLVNINSNELDNIIIVNDFGEKDLNTFFFESAVSIIAKSRNKRYLIVIDEDYMTNKYGIWVFEMVEQ
jgi:hypothetical protein